VHKLGHVPDPADLQEDQRSAPHATSAPVEMKLARAVGAAPSTVRDWFARRSSPTGKRAERVAELAEIIDRLARVIESDYIPVWLSRPIEALDDQKPLELIARGRARRVARVVSELESPGAV